MDQRSGRSCRGNEVMVDPPSVAYVEETVDSVTAVWYVSRVAMDISDSVPSGSLVYVTVCPLMTEESPEPLVDWGSDGGVAGKTLSGVSLGSGDGLMVRIDEREGGESIEEEWLRLDHRSAIFQHRSVTSAIQ